MTSRLEQRAEVVTIESPIVVQLIHALAADLEENCAGALPQDYNVVKYHRPTLVRPEDCPLLTVWLVGKPYGPRTTNNFHYDVTVGVSWQEPALGIQDLIDHPEQNVQMLEVVEALEQRIRTLSLAQITTGQELRLNEDPIAQLNDLYLSRTDYIVPTALETGLVEGYAMTVVAECFGQG